MATVFLLPALLLVAPAARDWPLTLREDAQALHDEAANNHPGPVNTLDPHFTRRNDAGLALVLKRAGQVHDFVGY